MACRDLRASEASALRALVTDAIGRAVERSEAVIVEELVAAGLAFGGEYPDAPRTEPPAPRDRGAVRQPFPFRAW